MTVVIQSWAKGASGFVISNSSLMMEFVLEVGGGRKGPGVNRGLGVSDSR